MIRIKCLAQCLVPGECLGRSVYCTIQQGLSMCRGPGTQLVAGHRRQSDISSSSSYLWSTSVCQTLC